MSLVRHTPQGMTPWFDFDRFFEGFDQPFGVTPWKANGGYTPAVDIYEDEKAIVLTADLPAMDEKDLDIRVENGHLSIKGERKFENEAKKENYHRVERRYGAFRRTFALPDTVDAEHIAAKYDKGVLKVTLPKVEKPNTARSIPVK